MSKVVSDMTRAGALLDLLFTNREGLVGHVLVGGYLKHSEHEVIKFSILDEKMGSNNKISTLGLQREDFDLFWMLTWKISVEAAFPNKGIWEG